MKMPLGSSKPYSKSKRHQILQPVLLKRIPAKLSDCRNQNVWAVKAGVKRILRLYTSIYRVALGSATLFRLTSYCSRPVRRHDIFGYPLYDKHQTFRSIQALCWFGFYTYMYVYITQTVNAFIILKTICIVTWLQIIPKICYKDGETEEKTLSALCSVPSSHYTIQCSTTILPPSGRKFSTKFIF